MVTAGVRHPPLVQSMFSPEQQGHTHGHSLHGACGRYRHILPEGRWMRKQGLSGTGNPVLLYEMSKTLLPEGTGAPEDVDYQSGSGDPEACPGLIVDEQQPQGLTHSCILTKTDSRGRIQNSTIKGRHTREESGETRYSFFPQWSHRGCVHMRFNQKCGVTACVKCSRAWKLIIDSGSGFLLGAGLMGPPCLGYTQTWTPRRNASVQHKPHCLCKQFSGSY